MIRCDARNNGDRETFLLDGPASIMCTRALGVDPLRKPSQSWMKLRSAGEMHLVHMLKLHVGFLQNVHAAFHTQDPLGGNVVTGATKIAGSGVVGASPRSDRHVSLSASLSSRGKKQSGDNCTHVHIPVCDPCSRSTYFMMQVQCSRSTHFMMQVQILIYALL